MRACELGSERCLIMIATKRHGGRKHANFCNFYILVAGSIDFYAIKFTLTQTQQGHGIGLQNQGFHAVFEAGLLKVFHPTIRRDE